LDRRIILRSTQIIPILVLAAIILLGPNARADDRRPESTEAQSTKIEADRDCAPTAAQGLNQDSQQEHGTKKRSLLRSWLDMAEDAQASQPDWLSPVATTSGRLKSEFRYDLGDQPSIAGNRTYELGGNKGLELIISPRMQLLAGIPTYTLQSPSGPPGGLGDLPLMLKAPDCLGATQRRELPAHVPSRRDCGHRFTSLWRGRCCGITYPCIRKGLGEI
jgi:hypothetical protein